ncbi:hypothetical protein TWF694_000715 [Orbilia ellipsospora]|uniref:Uncharacterized protein n=1 Tax=Orbilia ellipsospora TaxID=2528407 RepID=A0AAV9XPE6_9PEZI
MQKAHAMQLTSASLSLLQQSQKTDNHVLVASYVAKQAAYPSGQCGVERGDPARSESPASLIHLGNSSVLETNEESTRRSEAAALVCSQQKEPKAQHDQRSDKLPHTASVLDTNQARKRSRKRRHSDSSLISPIKERKLGDGMRDESEASLVSWPTSPARRSEAPLVPTKEIFQKPKRQKMRESRLSNKVYGETEKNKKKGKPHKATGKQVKIAEPAFGRLASSAVESEHLSGGRLTVRQQITSGLFHKGRVSVLKTRTAHLTFSEMEFLRQRAPTDHRCQMSEGQDHTKPLAQEQISSYFQKVASPFEEESISHNLITERGDAINRERGGVNSQLKIQEKQQRIPIPISISSSSGASRPRNGSTSTAPKPIIRKSKIPSSLPSQSPQISTKSVFGSLSVNSSGGRLENHSRLGWSETTDPVVAWLRTTPWEYDPTLEGSRAMGIEKPLPNSEPSSCGPYVSSNWNEKYNSTVDYPDHVLRDVKVTNSRSKWSCETNRHLRSSLPGENSILEEITVPSITSDIVREVIRWREGLLSSPAQHFELDQLINAQTSDPQEIFGQTLQPLEPSSTVENPVMRNTNIKSDTRYYYQDEEPIRNYEVKGSPPRIECNLSRTAPPYDDNSPLREPGPSYEAIHHNEFAGLVETSWEGTEFDSANTGLGSIAETSSCFNSMELATETNEEFVTRNLNPYMVVPTQNESDCYYSSRESISQCYLKYPGFESANNVYENTKVFHDEETKDAWVVHPEAVLATHDGSQRSLGPKGFWRPHRLY